MLVTHACRLAVHCCSVQTCGWRSSRLYRRTSYSVLFFFFQAEDGIRDLTVTGVQTCALPISRHGGDRRRAPAARPVGGPELRRTARGPARLPLSRTRLAVSERVALLGPEAQIGRASCRGRV